MNYAVQAAKLTISDIAKLLEELDKVKQELSWFKRQIFGKKSEKRVPTPSGQMWLGEGFKEPEEEQPVPQTEKIAYERKKRKRGVISGAVDEEGLQFDESVPVRVVKIPNPDIKGLVEGKDYKIISVRTHSELAQKPATYFVLRYEEKVVKIQESGELVSDIIKPEGVFPGSYADVSFVANLLIDKIQYHLPLYRQHQRISAAKIDKRE